MRKGLGALLSTGGAAALVIGLAATTSFATTATTWTVSPGGFFKAQQSGKIVLTDTTTAKSITCAVTTGKGSLKSGTGLSGIHIGTLNPLSFTSCAGPAGAPYTLTASNVPWVLNFVTYNPAITGGLTTGTLTGIHLTIAGTTCSATVDGTTATANDGATEIHFHNSLDKLKIRPSSSNLHAYNVAHCGTLIKTGDAITLSFAYLLKPAQKVTSP